MRKRPCSQITDLHDLWQCSTKKTRSKGGKNTQVQGVCCQHKNRTKLSNHGCPQMSPSESPKRKRMRCKLTEPISGLPHPRAVFPRFVSASALQPTVSRPKQPSIKMKP
ncbi:hypothetical protein VTH06DRAFT_5354 [Thermothelomyces fergusii]